MPELCQSFWPGHVTHWIPVLRVYAETPRDPIQIEHLGGTAFRVLDLNTQETHIWHHHQPRRLARYLGEHPLNVVRVRGAEYVIVKHPDGGYWFNMSLTEINECPAQKAEQMTETYLASNILVGYSNGTTWLLSNQKPKEEATPPATTTFVITACDPRSEKAELQQNHVNTLALEQDLIRNGLEYHIGWGSSQDNLHAELSFCVPVADKVAIDATRYLLTELAKDYEQNAIFEIIGTRVKLVPCLDPNAVGEVTKYATQIAEPQSHFKQLLNSLRWIAEVDPADLAMLDELINEKLGETNA